MFENVKTFGDNIDAVGTQGKGCKVENVTFKDLYYGSTQQEIFVSTALTPDKYHGAALNLQNVEGSLTVEGLHVDKVKNIVAANKPVTVHIKDGQCVCCKEEYVLSGGAEVR